MNDDELEVIVERAAGLDVHKDMVAVDGSGAGARRVASCKHQAEFATFTEELCAAAGLAGRARGDPGRDGGHRGLLEAGVLRARGRRSSAGCSTPGTCTTCRAARPTSPTPTWICRAGRASGWCGRVSCRPDRSGVAQPDPLPRAPRSRNAPGRRNGSTRSSKTPAIKLSSVASDILGRVGSGHARRAGRRRAAIPRCSPSWPEARCGPSLPQLQTALAGRFGAHHALVVGEILAHIDYLDESIDAAPAPSIDELIAPFADARDRLCYDPGGRAPSSPRRSIAEIGVDMAALRRVTRWRRGGLEDVAKLQCS